MKRKRDSCWQINPKSKAVNSSGQLIIELYIRFLIVFKKLFKSIQINSFYCRL